MQYFTRGAGCTEGPTRLLGAITPDPALLIRHFVAVALVAANNAFWSIINVANTQCSLNYRSYPIYMCPFGIAKSISVFYTACAVIIPLIRSELYGVKQINCL